MSQSGYCQLTLVGYVGRDPEVKHMDNGTKISTFSMAYTDRRDTTNWYRVTAFGKLADIVGEYVSKGRQVLVVGELSPRTYQGRDGDTKTSLDVTASEVRMLGKREDGNGRSEAATQTAAVAKVPEDYIPF